MRILLHALELAPFIRVGGVGDALAGLAQALVARGHEVTAALPARPSLVSAVSSGGIEVIPLAVEGFADANPYRHDVDATGEDSARLASLTAAVIGLCRERARAGAPFDLLHVHDWPTAMTPCVLRLLPQDSAVPRTVLTVHNGALQGVMPIWGADAFGLDRAQARELRHAGMVSTLRAGILTADAVTTVSPTYARELTMPRHGFGLQDLWTQRPPGAAGAAEPMGILNGIDTRRWDPSADTALAAPFSVAALANRALCKRALLAELGLADEPAVPLVVSASRLYAEKGADILAEALPAITELGARVIVAGAGDAAHERAIGAAVGRLDTGRALFVGLADEVRMRRLLAAADLLLVCSRRESCGLVQMYAQRYGAVPVAHRTGGLVDTITDETARPGEGTGFLFEPDTVAAIVEAMQRALTLFGTAAWAALLRRCMQLDRSWDRAAAAYERLYAR